MDNLQPLDPERRIISRPANQELKVPCPIAGGDLDHLQLPRLPLASNPAALRTIDEIDKRMAQEGFPELARHWREFGKLGIELSHINPSALAAARSKHMSPFFSRPLFGAGLIAGLAYIGADRYVSSIVPLLHGFPAALIFGFKALSVFNYAFLMTEAATYLQRRVFRPMERIMALDVAFMLAKRNFRSWLDASQQGREAGAAMSAAGINNNWDNPDYRAHYRLKGEHCERLPASTPEQLVHISLREFLGEKDGAQRRFVPGRYSGDLVEGKRSVTEFVRRHQSEIELSKAGELPLSQGIRLLSELLETAVKPKTKGAAVLREKLAGLSSGADCRGRHG